MPQFDPANFVPQAAWLVLAFAILYFGIVGATLPKLARTVDRREGKVAGDIAAAEQARVEQNSVHDAYEAEIKAAHLRAHDLVAEAKRAAIADTEGKLGAAGAELHAQQERAFAELEAARGRALSDIETMAADAATEIVVRLGVTRPDPGIARAAAHAALAS